MTNYEKIKRIIECGHIAQVKLENGRFMLYSSIEKDGKIRMSCFDNTTLGCYDTLGNNSTNKDETNQLDIESITAYQQKIECYKEGDRVVVLDSVSGLSKSNIQNHIGETLTVSSVNVDGSYILSTSKTYTITLCPTHLSPYLGPKEDIEIDGFKYKLVD